MPHMTKPKRKVVDMFTGNAMDACTQDTEANDLAAQHGGTYVGVLSKETAEHLRKQGQLLQARQAQLTEAVFQWEQDQRHHLAQIQAVLLNLGASKSYSHFDNCNVIIDKDGHVFLIQSSRFLN